jgi:hypothetical protein
MHPPLEIAALRATADTVAALSALLIETVASGGSVSFMHPLAPEEATAFWTKWLEKLARAWIFRSAFLVGHATISWS